MKSIKEAIDSKPSNALRFAITGLQRQSQRPDFVIDMDSFGFTDSKFCFGCLATSAIQEVFQIDFQPGQKIFSISDRQEILNVDYSELAFFENAIDSLRYGNVSDLFLFCDIEGDVIESFDLDGFYMKDDNWQSCIPTLEQLIENLEALGY